VLYIIVTAVTARLIVIPVKMTSIQIYMSSVKLVGGSFVIVVLVGADTDTEIALGEGEGEGTGEGGDGTGGDGTGGEGEGGDGEGGNVEDNLILLGLLGGTKTPGTPSTSPTPSQTAAMQALSQALRIGDPGEPLFGSRLAKRRNVWNTESLRIKDELGG